VVGNLSNVGKSARCDFAFSSGCVDNGPGEQTPMIFGASLAKLVLGLPSSEFAELGLLELSKLGLAATAQAGLRSANSIVLVMGEEVDFTDPLSSSEVGGVRSGPLSSTTLLAVDGRLTPPTPCAMSPASLPCSSSTLVILLVNNTLAPTFPNLPLLLSRSDDDFRSILSLLATEPVM
jgi:hypothetical protein